MDEIKPGANTLGLKVDHENKETKLLGYVNSDYNSWANNKIFLEELEKLMIKHKVQKIDICWKREFEKDPSIS